ncbi:hypothetical protein H9L19_06950 [Weissella diestrammenae]|uniref:Competence protein CoiA n=1 Tax=Weissella diestrammenae TaxID=1162633 RepID=A0A7G9T4S9_9LACO|nr:competence protein CoiA family protein [Weissella diestrammenae]QNN75104.1 hypothetical protein H9L19_06950 [Weissella diestrammenae]
MLTAVDVTGNTILARDAQKKQNYFCPACRQRVCLRLGQIRVQHFSHVQIMTCRAMSEGESVEHLFGKLQLHTYFVSLGYQVTLEKFLPAIQQRPDLVVESQGRCFIIEFQCAPISFETIKKRNTGYARIGLQVFWILGTPYQKQNLRQTTMAKFAQIQQNHLGFYYWVSQPSGGIYSGKNGRKLMELTAKIK